MPASRQRLNSFLESRGCRYPLSQGYGSERGISAASCCCNGNFKSLSVGYPLLTTTIGIFEPGTDKELGYGEEGEICISGPSIMLGYLNNKAETENVIRVMPTESCGYTAAISGIWIPTDLST